jgi:hypothetical protein
MAVKTGRLKNIPLCHYNGNGSCQFFGSGQLEQKKKRRVVIISYKPRGPRAGFFLGSRMKGTGRAFFSVP